MKLRPEHQPKNITPLEKTAEITHGLETVNEEIFFNYRAEFTDQDFTKLKQFVTERLSTRFPAYSYILSIVNQSITLFPERRKEFSLDSFFGEIIRRISTTYETKRSVGDHFISQNLEDLVTCFPNKKMELLAKNNKNLIKRDFFRWKENKQWGNFLEDLKSYLVIFPEEKNKINLGKEDIDAIRVSILQNFSISYKITANELATFYIVFPELRNQVRLPKEYLEEMLEKFEENKDVDYEHIDEKFRLGFNLAVITAQKTDITPEGQIKITPKPKPLATTEPLPQRPV